MLKGSLTGDGLVAMVANVHPGRSHFEDSNNTLEYAMRASTMKPRRRARASLPGSAFQMDFAVGQTHPSARFRRSVTGGTHQAESEEHTAEEEPMCLASSSTLPPPTQAAAERARQRNKRNAGLHLKEGKSALKETIPRCIAAAWAPGDKGASEVTGGDSPESNVTSPTSASVCEDRDVKDFNEDLPTGETVTPEECLSELSLPDEDREAVMDSDGCAGGDCSEPEESSARISACVDGLRLDVPDEEEVSAFNATMLTANVIESLQAEKVDLDARLRAVSLERDALLQDRSQLEQENARLRAANLEKDRQLAMLLGGAPMTPVMPATPSL
jgi:hypothetical protein